MRKYNIYKGMIVLGINSAILLSACGKVSEVNYSIEDNLESSQMQDDKIYSIKDSASTNPKEYTSINSIENTKDNSKDDNFIIRVYDEFGNDVTDIYQENIKINEYVNIEEDTNSIEMEALEDIKIEDKKIEDQSCDEVIINYFNEKKQDLNNTVDLEEFKEKAINLFITITDFIFYDTDIYGIKYNDLKEETKKTILNDFKEVDSIISIKYPTYKEDIKLKYDKAKDFTVDKYNMAIDKLKSGLSVDTLNSIDDTKESLKDTASSIKDTTSDIYSDQKVKVKSWYENLKNKQ